MDPIYQQLSKVYTRGTNDKAVCLAALCFYVLPRHTNIIADKGFNIFDECAARLSTSVPSTSSSWGDSKMYTSGSIANSQRMLTEINESGTIAEIRIWVESDTVKY